MGLEPRWERGGGGGQKTYQKIPFLPNCLEFIVSITNMLLFFSGGLGKSIMVRKGGGNVAVK